MLKRTRKGDAAMVINLVSIDVAVGQQQATQPAENLTTKARPDARIGDLAWIAGHWNGQAMGGQFEETWNAPMGGTMMGMFKFVQDDAVVFYEILTIVPDGDSLMLRLKHFDAGLKGWEEKDESVEFPLVSLTRDTAKFDGLIFQRINDNEMQIQVTTKEEGKESQELTFHCKRVTR